MQELGAKPMASAVKAQANHRLVNPHFDHDRIVWDDRYSGQYEPVAYDRQFDDQWRLFLEGARGFHDHTGVETTDPYIEDRIYELTGVTDFLSRRRYGGLYPLVNAARRLVSGQPARDIGGRLVLEPKFPIDYFKGKRSIDIGCGAGRWTRVLLELGASVKSVDMSEHGLKSTRRFNPDVEQVDIFSLKSRTVLNEAFDFAICWGVVMCTHDPKVAFENVASTVRPGGDLYVMVYAPTYHASDFVTQHRKFYHANLTTFQEKLDYAYKISDTPENAINLLDMLNTFYNWTIPEEVIVNWYTSNGFKDVKILNRNEQHFCGYHVLGRKA
jgi:2-polyprenyl-3-methyl-5-hydroxy-6-metoxy-1,4-benzoquinol methylase